MSSDASPDRPKKKKKKQHDHVAPAADAHGHSDDESGSDFAPLMLGIATLGLLGFILLVEPSDGAAATSHESAEATEAAEHERSHEVGEAHGHGAVRKYKGHPAGDEHAVPPHADELRPAEEQPVREAPPGGPDQAEDRALGAEIPDAPAHEAAAPERPHADAPAAPKPPAAPEKPAVEKPKSGLALPKPPAAASPTPPPAAPAPAAPAPAAPAPAPAPAAPAPAAPPANDNPY
jgi:hypothetical protein